MKRQWVARRLPVSLVGLVLSGGAIVSLLCPVLAEAQIIPDETLGTQVTPFTPGACTGAGGSCGITNGTVRGRNLFHSFQQFSLPNGDLAGFITGSTIQNVIVRVTGVGQPFISNINGAILTLDNTLNLSPKNFFLINPNGIIFGPNAQILVGGSFLASTAERMLFQDGTAFDTRDRTVAPLLTMSVPIGLQVGQTPGRVQLQESFLFAGSRDSFTNIALVGGAISLDNTWVYAPGYRIDLGSVNSQGTVSLNSDGSLQVADNTGRGDVELTNGSRLAVDLDRGGDIAITGRNINISGSLLQAGMSGGLGTLDNQAGDVKLKCYRYNPYSRE